MGKRGRPANRMTQRRAQVLEHLVDRSMDGEPPSLAELARRVGLYDFRDARRVVRDLRRMGAVN